MTRRVTRTNRDKTQRSDISDDNDSHQETELHDNSDVISLEAESDGERFDPTEGNPAAFAGPNKLYEIVKKEGKFKIGLGKIKQFLNNEDAYSLYKPIRRTFPRSKVVVDTIDSMWDGD
uniref:Uncharacterized protein n=1 Tax=Magallana gigas TaxID=29159 RepID=A0A8W8MME9_MAGGI